MSGSMCPQQRAVLGDLDGVADQANANDLTDLGVADAISRAGEADAAGPIDLAQHLIALGRLVRLRRLGPTVDAVIVVGEMTTITASCVATTTPLWVTCSNPSLDSTSTLRPVK